MAQAIGQEALRISLQEIDLQLAQQVPKSWQNVGTEERCTLPGGWVDVNEPPSLEVEREMREEAGVIVKAVKLLVVYDRNLHRRPYFSFHAYNFFILCEGSGQISPDPLETSDPTFFAEDEIPELSTPRSTLSEIHRMFEHFRNPDFPTDFD